MVSLSFFGVFMDYFVYLQQIIDNPNTPREEYLRAEREMQAIDAHQRYLDAYYTKLNDKLTGGQNV
jgi:hypothetical protein